MWYEDAEVAGTHVRYEDAEVGGMLALDEVADFAETHARDEKAAETICDLVEGKFMIQKHCFECGAALEERELDGEGIIPYCPHCEAFRFPLYNVAVSMIVRNRANGKILLIQQYGRASYILVAGYVNRGEREEDAVVREIKEETGMNAVAIHFNRTKFFEPSNTLMCNFTAWVEDDSELHPNGEIDRYSWFTPAEARKSIRPDSLAEEFLCAYLDDAGL